MISGIGNVYMRTLSTFFSGCALLAVAMLASCSKKQDGYILAGSKVTAVIQINTNNTNYSLSSVPDVISMSSTTVAAGTKTYKEYLVKGVNTANTLSFNLAFYDDTLNIGKYVMEGSQLTIGSKSYISLASKSTDKVTVTKMDDTKKVYTGTFSFYAFNPALLTDSVLVTGAYSIQ